MQGGPFWLAVTRVRAGRAGRSAPGSCRGAGHAAYPLGRVSDEPDPDVSERRGPGPARGSPHPRRRCRRRAARPRLRPARRRPERRRPSRRPRAPRAGGPSGSRSSRATPLASSRAWAASSCRRAASTCSRSRLAASLSTIARTRAGMSPGGGQPDGLDHAEEARLAAAGQRETGDERHGIARVTGAVDADQEPARSPCRAPLTTSTAQGACRTTVRLTLPRRKRPTAPRPAGAEDDHPRADLRARVPGSPATGGASVTKTSASGQRRRRRCSAR